MWRWVPWRRVGAVVTAAWVLSLCSLASAQESGAFVAEPAPGSQLAPSGGYFLLAATPGQVVEQSVVVRNGGAQPVELHLDAVDAVTGQYGGVSYGLPGEKPRGPGAWITLDRATVTLAAGASQVVPFRVAVPTDAVSGQHLAGLAIAAPGEETSGAGPGAGQAGASVDVRTRRVIAVQVDLPGPNAPELVIDGIAPEARADGLYLGVAITNRGRGFTKAKGVVRVEQNFERQFEIDTFVPGTTISYPIKWLAEAPEGDYEARVELRYGDVTERWNGTFTVGEAVQEALADRRVESTQEGGEELGASVGQTNHGADEDVPLALVALAAAALAVAALLLGRSARSTLRPRDGERRLT